MENLHEKPTVWRVRAVTLETVTPEQGTISLFYAFKFVAPTPEPWLGCYCAVKGIWLWVSIEERDRCLAAYRQTLREKGGEHADII